MDTQVLILLLALSGSVLCWKATPVITSWIRSHKLGAPIQLHRLWGMYFQNVPLTPVIDAYASAREADVTVNIGQLASHAKSGGDVHAVVYAYVETLRSGATIDFMRVCEIELEEASSKVDPEGGC